MQKPLGGHPLRFIILGFVLCKTFRGTPLAICDLGNYVTQKPLGGHPLRSVILGSEIYKNLLGGRPLRFMILDLFYAKPLGDTHCDVSFWNFVLRKNL